MIIAKSGFGYNIHTDHIWPDSLEDLLAFIDLAPEYAKTLAEVRNEIDPSSPYARAEFLESLNFDKPEAALAEVIQHVLHETDGLDLITAIDFADSDNVILACPDGDASLDLYTRKKVESTFNLRLSFLQAKFPWPSFQYWQEEIPDKREFFVDTPLGKLRVWAKHPNGDSPADYPGVFVDFIPKDGTDHILLACVEYESSEELIQTCVHGNGLSDEPTAVVKHENLEVSQDE